MPAALLFDLLNRMLNSTHRSNSKVSTSTSKPRLAPRRRPAKPFAPQRNVDDLGDPQSQPVWSMAREHGAFVLKLHAPWSPEMHDLEFLRIVLQEREQETATAVLLPSGSPPGNGLPYAALQQELRALGLDLDGTSDNRWQVVRRSATRGGIPICIIPLTEAGTAVLVRRKDADAYITPYLMVDASLRPETDDDEQTFS